MDLLTYLSRKVGPDLNRSGFSRMIRELIFLKYLDIYHLERYRHRMSMDGKPLYYCGLSARKQYDVPDGFLEKYDLVSD